MKNFLFSLTIFQLMFQYVNAQSNYDPIEPGPNAQQFVTATSRQHGLHTGDLSVSIPLFKLEGNGYDIPISISYSGSGIDHTTESSSIGLGWSLLAGGVISHTIRGYSDENQNGPNVWHTNANFLQNKFNEELSDSWPDNVMSFALDAVRVGDAAPDNYNYSFLGFSGDIRFSYSAQNIREAELFPDNSFKLIKTTNGYKIITNQGAKYYFEGKESKSDDATAWFLTRIETLKGGVATFQYADDYSYDLTKPLLGEYMQIKSKRITRIDFDYGYVLFNSSAREDMYYNYSNKDAKRINSIELYNKDNILIKGFEFYNDNYFTNTQYYGSPSHNKRLKLSGIREYGRNANYLPPHSFEYSYLFRLPKTSLKSNNNLPNIPEGTWAHNPTLLVFVDRDYYGNPMPWITYTRYTTEFESFLIPEIHGHQTSSGDIDGNTISDYMQLDRIDFPTGGSESYFYENHDYAFVNTSRDTILPHNQSSSQISGKRISEVVKSNAEGHTETIEYKYFLHDHNYELIEDGYFAGSRGYSSGILINPTIHKTAIYKPEYDWNRNRLAASPFFTKKPQNQKNSHSVTYTHVLKNYKSSEGESNGKELFVFEAGYAELPQNYVYVNYNRNSEFGALNKSNRLASVPNFLKGKEQYGNDPELAGYNDQYFASLSYPLGEIFLSDVSTGRLLEQITFDAAGNVKRKIKNEYEGGLERRRKSYGLFIEKFDDNDYDPAQGPGFYANRFLISRAAFYHGLSRPSRNTVVHYFNNDSVVEQTLYTYTSLNLVRSTTKLTNNGNVIKQKFTYPNDIVFDTLSNLDTIASAIKNMVNLNILSTPLQTDVTNGVENIGGTFVSFKTLSNNSVQLKDTYKFSKKSGLTTVAPRVNVQGKLQKDENFYKEAKILNYDSFGNPSEIQKESGLIVSYIWGYNGQHPIAKIENGLVNNLSSQISGLRNLSNLDKDNSRDKLNPDGTIDYQGSEGNLRASLNALRTHLSLAQARITTYTYDPLIGLTSITDPLGRTRYFIYDDFNRLSSVKDEKGNILSENFYNYK